MYQMFVFGFSNARLVEMSLIVIILIASVGGLS